MKLHTVYSPNGEKFEVSKPNFDDLTKNHGWSAKPPEGADPKADFAYSEAPPAPVPPILPPEHEAEMTGKKTIDVPDHQESNNPVNGEQKAPGIDRNPQTERAGSDGEIGPERDPDFQRVGGDSDHSTAPERDPMFERDGVKQGVTAIDVAPNDDDDDATDNEGSDEKDDLIAELTRHGVTADRRFSIRKLRDKIAQVAAKKGPDHETGKDRDDVSDDETDED